MGGDVRHDTDAWSSTAGIVQPEGACTAVPDMETQAVEENAAAGGSSNETTMPQHEEASDEPRWNASLMNEWVDVCGVPFVSNIVSSYVDAARECLAALEQGIEHDDYAAVAASAHGLKGMSLNIGVERVAALCQRVEARARAQSSSGLAQTYSQLHEEVEWVLAVLSRFVSERTVGS